MGFDALSAPPAAHKEEIDEVVDGFRASMVRASLQWLVVLVTRRFEGNSHLVMCGSPDRQSVLVRQVAIYLAHTRLRIPEVDCARVFNLSKMAATRGLQAIEARRELPPYRLKLEWLELQIAARRAAAEAV